MTIVDGAAREQEGLRSNAVEFAPAADAHRLPRVETTRTRSVEPQTNDGADTKNMLTDAELLESR